MQVAIISESSARPLLSMVLLGCASCVLSLLSTRLMLWLLPQLGMMDRPDFKRHIHTHAVPRGGGIGMLLAFIVSSAVYFCFLYHGGRPDTPRELVRILAPLAILLPLGVLDDRFTLRARTKFICQILAALLAWCLGLRLETVLGVHLPAWLGLPLTVIWITAFINAFNMIDGVDGLASGIGLISAVCMAVTAFFSGSPRLGTLLVIFGGSLLGFLYFNWHPAKLFMGDTGSMFIGYVLAVAGLRINARVTSVASIGIPLLACGLPVLDICLAVWRRLVGSPPSSTPEAATDGEEMPHVCWGLPGRLAFLAGRLSTADQSHIHHRLMRYFRNDQRRTVWSIYAIAIGMGLVGILCSFLPNSNLLVALAVIIGTFSFIINRLAFIELWNTTETLYHDFQSARAGMLFSYVINPLWDLGCILAAYYLASRGWPIGLDAMLRHAGILMAVLCCSRPYRVFWNYAASDEYFRLASALLLGFTLARASDLAFPDDPHINRLHSYAAGVAITLILMERLFLHYFRNDQIRRHAREQLDDGAEPLRTIIVGVTPMARLYRNLLTSDIERAAREEIIGLVCFDRHFLHSYCYGMKVLGRINDLEFIVEHYRVGKIVVTREMPEELLGKCTAVCRGQGVRMASFGCVERVMG